MHLLAPLTVAELLWEDFCEILVDNFCSQSRPTFAVVCLPNMTLDCQPFNLATDPTIPMCLHRVLGEQSLHMHEFLATACTSVQGCC